MTYVIAEVGSNWKIFEHAKDSIQMAKVCGADAVKFQLFTFKELYGLDTVDGRNESELPRDWLPKLKEKADAAGIDFMCTAFSSDGAKYVDQFVNTHKIASSNLTDFDLLATINTLGKPVYLSTGASSLGDIAQALKLLDKVPVTLMYCVSAYPSTEHNLFVIDTLKKQFSLPVGFSDHSLDKIYAPLSAVKHFNAVAIEKHVNFANIESPDSWHSIDREWFRYLCDVIKGKKELITKPVETEEEHMYLWHNVRLISTEQINPGEELLFNKNYGCYRSVRPDTKGAIGLSAMAFHGKRAKETIRPGDPIHFAVVE